MSEKRETSDDLQSEGSSGKTRGRTDSVTRKRGNIVLGGCLQLDNNRGIVFLHKTTYREKAEILVSFWKKARVFTKVRGVLSEEDTQTLVFQQAR